MFASSRGRWVIAATVLGSGIASLDAKVVAIALPTIGRAFHGGVGTLQWVVSGYSLTLAAFLLLGGSLGDRMGRRRIFSIGVVWFALASMLCGFAPNAGVLIGARILQASFRESDRSRAIGAWSGLGLALLFLAGLTNGLIEAPSHGWTSPVVLASLIVAALTAPALLIVEHRSAHPMLPLGVFRSRQFSGANAVTFAVYGALGGALFLLPVELQLVVHYSPLESGLALLPVTFIMLVFSARSGQLAARIGPRLQMTAGPFVVAAGLLLLTRASLDPDLYIR